MYDIRKISDDIFYVGCSDRRLALFESAYPIPNGISYNSYLIKDEKIVEEVYNYLASDIVFLK